VSPAGGRPVPFWSWLLLPALMAAVAVAAELIGRRAEVYCGAAAGLLLGLVGHLFTARAVSSDSGASRGEKGPGTLGAKHPEEPARQRVPDPFSPWCVWGAGFLVRFVLMGLLAGVFWLAWPGRFALPMLSMAAVYLALHFLEIAWLCRKADCVSGNRSTHG